MTSNQISPEESDRICNHMNNDHADAVNIYAQCYGGIAKPMEAKMISISSYEMALEVDGKSVLIPFEHTLVNSKDAHKTLVAMLKAFRGQNL